MAFIAALVVSFALTTLDSATRLLRYNVAEIGESIGVPVLKGRVTASVIAVLAIAFFAFYEVDGRPMGRVLWNLFGTTNQLVAGVTLLVVSIWLRRMGRPVVYTLVPMIFVGAVTVVAMLGEVRGYFESFSERWLLAVMGSVVLVLDVWVIGEGFRVLLAERGPVGALPEPGAGGGS